VAVFLMESRGSPLSGDELVGLTDYMSTLLGAKGKFQIIPRGEIRKRLVDQKSKSHKNCYDRACQIEIGRELAAQYTINSSITKVGTKCLITAQLFDLRKAITEATANEKVSCDPDDLIVGVESIAKQFGAEMAAGETADTAVADAAPQPEPAPPPTPAPPPSGEQPDAADLKSPRDDWSAQPTGDGAGSGAAAAVEEKADTGWAMGAGITGIISAVGVLGLSVGAAVNVDDTLTSMSMGGTATLGLIVFGPVVSAGARSPTGEGVHGSTGLKVGGWVTYGLGVANAVTLLLMGAASAAGDDVLLDDATMAGLITVTGLLGATSLTLFSIDAFIARGQAARQMAVRSSDQDAGLRIAPVFAPIAPPAQHPGAAGMSVGLAGSF
jgi:hypothetical protein